MINQLLSPSPAIEMQGLKARLKTTWEAGDYGHFSKYLEIGAKLFFERLEIQPGMEVLDVACGAGQISFLAARAGAEVTGIDIASNLIEQARARAEAENMSIRFEEGDAEELPFEAGSFDCVVSSIGAMFAPRPELVASEMLRVCRPGGMIAMANWTPCGFVGQMFKVIARHVPPPSIMPSPMLWGDPAVVRDRFAGGVSQLMMVKRMYPMSYPFSAAEVVEFFRLYYGPTNRAFAALDPPGQEALRADLELLWSEYNYAPGAVYVPAEYLEVIAVRR